MPVQDQLRAVQFPIYGLDVSLPAFDQRPGTAPVAINCRAYDSGTRRLRGGSRAGLTPFFGAGSTTQVSGFNRIQSLSTIVIAQQGATFENVVIAPLNATVDYSESDHPPPRNAPTIVLSNNWYEGLSPVFTIVSGQCSPQDGGGTGRGTATFAFSTDGTTVTIVGTFQSAGFPGPYFYSGPAQVVTKTISQASFFPPGTGFVAFSWTVVNFATGFIGNLDVVFRTF